MAMHNPSHPGKILALHMKGRSVTDVAAHLGIARVTLSRVLNCKASVSAEMSLRLSKAFGTNPTFWLDLQTQRDVWVASQKKLKVKALPPVAA